MYICQLILLWLEGHSGHDGDDLTIGLDDHSGLYNLNDSMTLSFYDSRVLTLSA